MLGLENQFFKSTSLESRKYSKKKHTLLENSEHMKHRQVKIDVSENFDAVKLNVLYIFRMQRTSRVEKRCPRVRQSFQYLIHYCIYSILHQLQLVAWDSIRLKGVKLE